MGVKTVSFDPPDMALLRLDLPQGSLAGKKIKRAHSKSILRRVTDELEVL